MKQEIIKARISAQEKERIRQEAQSLGLSISEYFRDIIREKIAKSNPYESEVMDLYEKVSDLIQKLEFERDYGPDGKELSDEKAVLGPEEAELYRILNQVWDLLRMAPHFHEGAAGFD